MIKCRNKCINIVAILLFIITIMGWTNTFANSFSPQNLVITTEKKVIGKVRYEDFEIHAEKIVSDVSVGYCLDIEEDYPAGETFTKERPVSERIQKVLSNGYPNKSAEQLGVDNDDDAYFATQIALWSIIEGYDVYKISGSKPNILKAIINIYENVQNNNIEPLKYNIDQYYVNDTIQRVAIFNKDEINVTPEFYNDGITEEAPNSGK